MDAFITIWSGLMIQVQAAVPIWMEFIVLTVIKLANKQLI